MSKSRLIHRGRGVGAFVLAAALIVVFSAPAEAIDLSSNKGSYTLNLDTTVSWGGRLRVADRDPSIISPFEGGTAWSVNGDDGNLNFEKNSLVSNSLKATIDFDFATSRNNPHQFGVFLRGSGFYDFALEQNCCERTELTQEALDWAGSRVELLDAFAWWQFPLGGGRRGEIRVGRQVLNWGESTFIQGGLSVINSVDLSALRVPGSELREAFRPQGMVWASFDLSANISVEAFYQYEWENIVVDPPGTYFSTNDFVGLGGERVFLAFASFPDTGESPFYIQPPSDYPFMSVPRGATQEPDDGGQYGLSLKWFLPNFGGTEFGFYYMNLHSRLPTINGVTGPISIVPGIQAAGAAAALQIYYFFGVPPGVSPQVDAAAAQAAQAAATSMYANSATWYTAYPEDIKVMGLSWNAQLGTSGIAFQGEISYRQDNPLQKDDVEVLFAALSPISAGLAATNQVVPGGAGFSETILGYDTFDTSQLQFTFTKVFSNFLGADQGVVVLEPGFNWVFDMPDKEELRFEGPGTYTSGNPIHALPGGAHAGKPAEEPQRFADDFSWGYRMAGRLTYNNAIGAWSLAPRFAWAHDVQGVSPAPGGSFIPNRKAFTIGLQAGFQNAWQIDLSYTDYSGAGRYNLINDRDFVGAFVKFSF